LTKNFGIQIVGGCCGTTPEHIKALKNIIGDYKVTPPKRVYENSVASLYSSVPLSLDPKPLYVGERTNANGSKLFRELLAKDDFDGLVAIAKGQLKEGAHVLDCCTAYVSRDEVKDMTQFIGRLATQVNIPVMIDSTEVPVIEASLKQIPGKAIVNSINFEDGEEKACKILELCKTYGASVVALTIDEEGMAKSCEKKVAIAQRIYDLAHGRYGLKPSDIIFDPLTFTLGSGDEEFRKSAIETLDAIEKIKAQMPGVLTILGLSNVSFGLEPLTRRYLNSVMLYHAVQKGLDLAICNAAKITPLFKIDADVRQYMEDLLYDRRKEGYDPLKSILAYFSDKKTTAPSEKSKEDDTRPLPERLAQCIVDGDKLSIIPLLDRALKENHKPLDIINNFLLDGMRIVGEKFGAGEMQLPFVLESAEAMKTSVAHLEPFMEKSEQNATKGKILLATVKGDVHDIGKNLVDIILSNNGFSVVNIGIKQPIETILEKYNEHKPDVIGLSGLLVKSTAIMKSDLEIMTHKKLQVPVILGGAALTRKFVEEDCQAAYQTSKVYYAQDAFEGLRIMGSIMGIQSSSLDKFTAKSPESSEPKVEAAVSNRPKVLAVKRSGVETPLSESGQSTAVKRLAEIPEPPFWGTKILEERPATVFKFLDEFALVRTRWQFVKGEMPEEEFNKILEDKARPILNTWKKRCEEENLLQPKAVYGYFACEAEGDQLHIYPNPESQEKLVSFNFPRQASGRRLCLSDYFNPRGAKRDVVAMQIVTMGHRAQEFSAELYKKGQYSDYFYFHGLSTEMAESYAELLHARIRKELGIHHKDAKNIRKLFSQGYQGSRYSFGYPACPDLEDNFKLFTCLKPEQIGVTLTESAQMVPEQSTCALIAWHPQARYFAV
jgi:5-methyltetrahydrofolate--homocysteine methyltransferase